MMAPERRSLESASVAPSSSGRRCSQIADTAKRGRRRHARADRCGAPCFGRRANKLCNMLSGGQVYLVGTRVRRVSAGARTGRARSRPGMTGYSAGLGAVHRRISGAGTSGGSQRGYQHLPAAGPCIGHVVQRRMKEKGWSVR